MVWLLAWQTPGHDARLFFRKERKAIASRAFSLPGQRRSILRYTLSRLPWYWSLPDLAPTPLPPMRIGAVVVIRPMRPFPRFTTLPSTRNVTKRPSRHALQVVPGAVVDLYR